MNLQGEITETALEAVQKRFYGVAVGIVTDVLDPLMQGRIKVKLPWFIGDEDTAWAQVVSPSAGSNRGIYFIPKVDDEVLVAFEQGDIEHPYIVGSLWNLQDMPPEESPLLGKSLIKTKVGHVLEFDDLKQSITITTSTKQKLMMDPSRIEVTTTEGTASITLDTAGNVSIQGTLSIKLKAPTIIIEGGVVDIKSNASTSINGGPACNIQAAMVKIN